MVTEEERQFMWDYYAPEPRMRLNLGIRRRLAPLLDNNRARIELANSLLFTLPGSPVIYYGDEIGMGDNIWLQDRNGVRTPMQWSDAPHAGFSKLGKAADPAKLYAPVIDEAPYSYRQLNVQAQQADPGSLLHRMREMIRVRKSQQALRRGEIRFLEVANLSALAYLRTYGDQSVLVVNNLSPERQEIEFDPSQFDTHQTQDLFSRKEVAALTAPNPSLTLDGYQYRWIRLR
jgi:maltose alpha-D-glucosyltransferase/alpha-amylase